MVLSQLIKINEEFMVVFKYIINTHTCMHACTHTHMHMHTHTPDMGPST